MKTLKGFLAVLIVVGMVTFCGTSWAEELIIGHVTDSHVGTANFQSFLEALSGASQLSDVVVVSGDCATSGAEKDLKKFMTVFEGIGMPYLVVPGNHDLSNKKYGESIWNRIVGPSEVYVDIDSSYRIIGINSLDINWVFLDQALNTDRICIVIGHFPIFPHRSETKNRKYSAEEWETLRARFKYFKVPLYICGHEHANILEFDQEIGTYYLGGKMPPTFQLIFMEDREVKGVVSGKISTLKVKILAFKEESESEEE